jgi:hypothetical protein
LILLVPGERIELPTNGLQNQRFASKRRASLGFSENGSGDTGRSERWDRYVPAVIAQIDDGGVIAELTAVENGQRAHSVRPSLAPPDGGLDSVVNAELAEGPGEVNLDGALGDVELARDHLVAEAGYPRCAGRYEPNVDLVNQCLVFNQTSSELQQYLVLCIILICRSKYASHPGVDKAL